MWECTAKEKNLIFLEKTSSYTNTHTFVCTFTGLLKEIFDWKLFSSQDKATNPEFFLKNLKIKHQKNH